MRFADRRDAGRQLATRVSAWHDDRPVVVALPRGGVPVGHEVADALDAPLDVLLVRKLGVPWQPELGLGAIGEGGVRILNDELLRMARVSDADLEEVTHRETAELERRVETYRQGRPPVSYDGRTVLLVDDGLATGFTARAAIEVARTHGAHTVVLAVPVAPRRTIDELADVADDVVCVHAPDDFGAIGVFYDDFAQTTDDEVVELLSANAARSDATSAGADEGPTSRHEVTIPTADRVSLPGLLTRPTPGAPTVVFAHGSGSSRLSPRNLDVATALNEAGFATLLFDLLTSSESDDRAKVFDIELLAARLIAATRWLRQDQATTGGIGYFGASTGAAAALWAAAELDGEVDAVVSRGGRPDLAAPRLEQVGAPTLLIVGGRDAAVEDLNRQALELLGEPSRLDIVPGATHLFEEPGALEEVASLATSWFSDYLSPASGRG